MMDKINNQRIGKNIRRYRKFAGMSQKALAELIDVNTNFISIMENGKNTISIEALIKVSNALGVSVSMILTDKSQLAEKERIVDNLKRIDNLPEKDKKLVSDILEAVLAHF